MNDSTSHFQIIALHPVADCHHAWVGVMLQSLAPLPGGDLARLFGEFGLYEALDDLPCIVSLPTPADCPADVAGLLPADHIVLRLPAAVCSDTGQREELARLRQAGFRLLSDGLPADPSMLAPGIAGFAMAGADVEGLTADRKAAVAGRPGPHLAFGVDLPAQSQRCREAGFDWLVGDYSFHAGSRGAHGATHQALLMRLLALVAADADSHEIEAIFKQDVHLSYQLLKLVNSVAFSLSTRIASFSQAIAILGRRQLQRWLQLLLYARASGEDANPLMARAAWRAELMEVLRGQRGGNHGERDRAFMVGMFSLLGQLLGMSIEKVVAPLNLADEVVQALVDRSGPLGLLLQAVEAAERDLPALPGRLAAANIDAAAWAVALVQAHHWAIRVSREA